MPNNKAAATSSPTSEGTAELDSEHDPGSPTQTTSQKNAAEGHMMDISASPGGETDETGGGAVHKADGGAKNDADMMMDVERPSRDEVAGEEEKKDEQHHAGIRGGNDSSTNGEDDEKPEKASKDGATPKDAHGNANDNDDNDDEDDDDEEEEEADASSSEDEESSDDGGGQGESSSGSDDSSSSEDDDDSSSSSEDDDDDANANANANANAANNNPPPPPPPPDGLSDYERLRLVRIQRNQDRLRQLGLVDMVAVPKGSSNSNNNKKKTKARKKIKAAPVIARSQPQRSVKSLHLPESQINGGLDVRKMRISSDPTYYDRLSKRSSSRPSNKCDQDERYSRRYRCGSCAGCTRQYDCGNCVYCIDRMKDKPTMKRRCIFRFCFGRLVEREVEVEVEVEVAAGNDDACGETSKAVGEGGKTEDVKDQDDGDAREETEKDGDGEEDRDGEEGGEKERDEGGSSSGEERGGGIATTTTTTKTMIKTITRTLGEGIKPGRVRLADGTTFVTAGGANASAAAAAKAEEGAGGAAAGGGGGDNDNDVGEETKEGGSDEGAASGGACGKDTSNGANKDGNEKDVIGTDKEMEDTDGATAKAANYVHDARTAASVDDVANVPVGSDAKGAVSVASLAADVSNNATMPERRDDGAPEEEAARDGDDGNNMGANENKTAKIAAGGTEAKKDTDEKEPDETTADAAAMDDHAKDAVVRGTNDAPATSSDAAAAAAEAPGDIVDRATTTTPGTCHICTHPGDLFCCDACPRMYHPSCHAPKVREIPEGDWLCMECSPKFGTGGAGGAGGGAGCGRHRVDLYAILPAGYDFSGTGASSQGEGDKDDDDDVSDERKKAGASSRSQQDDNKVEADPREAKAVKVTILEPRAKCSVCSDFGDDVTVLCRACDRYYHLECHDPPLYSAPRGRWRCNPCKVANVKVPVELLAEIPIDHTDADISGKTLKVSVVGPEATCSKCKERGGETVWCRACDESFHLKCHDPPLETKPRGRWRCGKCKKSNNPAPKPKSSVKRESLLANLKLFQGEHDDDCYICYNGGDLVCCDFCSKAFHMKCHIPPLPFIPDGIWKCCECSAVGRKRKNRCGECKACTRPECGKCAMCLDKPKFGGINTLKKPCVKKVCPYPRFAPPASATTVAGLITKLPTSSSPVPPSKSDSKKRSRESTDGSGTRSKKRAKLEKVNSEKEDIEQMEEETEDEFGGGPIVVKVRMSSLRSAYMDPDSIKIRKLINSALRDPKNSKAQDKACELLRKHITSPEAIKKTILFGGVEMICNAMREHPDKSIVQAEACCTLAEMIWIDPTICTKLAHEGAIGLIITCMDRLANNLKVQQMGCGAFRALSYDEKSMQHIHDADGLSAVLSSMKSNPKRLVVQKEGCYFLQNMLVQSTGIASTISKSQVVPILVQALSDESADDDFQQSVCGLVANLALDKKVKISIGKSDAISAIVATLNTALNLDVKQAACSALKHLALENSDNQARLSTAGGLEAAFGAIHSFPDDPVLLIAAIGVMKELCISDEEIAHEVVKKGGFKIILKAMEDNSDLAMMQFAACGLIGYLPYGKKDKNAPKLAKAIIAAMKNHDEVSYVQIEACDALLELAQVPAVCTILKEKATQELLLKAKEEFEPCESDVDDIIAACTGEKKSNKNK